MLHLSIGFWSHLQILAEVVIAATGVWATVKGLPLLANRLRLIQRNSDLEGQNTELRRAAETYRQAAEAYQLSSEGWQSAVEQLGDEIRKLTSEQSETRQEVHRLRTQLASAILYIADLHTYSRVGGAHVPPMPLDLRDAIEEVLKQRNIDATADRPTTTQ